MLIKLTKLLSVHFQQLLQRSYSYTQLANIDFDSRSNRTGLMMNVIPDDHVVSSVSDRSTNGEDQSRVKRLFQ